MKENPKPPENPKESVYISWKNDQWVATFKGEEIFSGLDQEQIIGKVLNKFSNKTFWLKIENQSGALRQALSIKPGNNL